MGSKLEAWNGALFLLGHSRVNSTTPDSEATRTLNEAWRKTVETCLEDGDWDFAKVDGELSRVSPAPAFGYTHFYQIPADSCRLVFVSPTGDINDPLTRYAMRGGKIATDADRVFATWISKNVVETPGIWTTSFSDYVEAMLAQRCLKLNPSARDDVELALRKAKPKAGSVDAVQGPPQFRRQGQWAGAARGGWSSREQG